MDITKIQSAGYNITYIAQPGEHGPRVLVDLRTGLTSATETYISTTYGQSVLTALRTWLRQHDITLMKTLANYINGDPDMVCSLGLSVEGVTLPTRWIVGDGSAYISTNIMPTYNLATRVRAVFPAPSGTEYIVGSANGAQWAGYSIFNYQGYRFYFDWCQYDTQYLTISAGADMLIYAHNGFFFINGTQYGSAKTGSYTWQNPLAIFARNIGSGFDGIAKIKIQMCEFYDEDGGTMIANFIPCIHNGENGMLDLVNAQWYGNVASSGAFTITEE